MSRRGGRGGGRRAQRESNDDEWGGERSGMTAFNMEDEKDEGHFDDDGNFFWNKEDKRVQEEAWLDDVDEEQIGAAMAAKNQRAYRDEQAVETMTEAKANRILSTLLQPRESVLKALQRLGSKRPKHRGTKRKQPLGDAPAVQTADEKAQFEQVTDAADFLMRQGEVDVYSQIREEFVPEHELLAQRSSSGDASASRVTFADNDDDNGDEERKSEERPPPAAREVLWEYRGADGEIHGPFPSSSFMAWQTQGYFTGASAVDIRQVASAQPDDTGSAASTTESASTPAAAEPTEPVEKISAEQELLNDFEDSEDDDEDQQAASSSADTVQPDAAKDNSSNANPWRRSDQVDFASY